MNIVNDVIIGVVFPVHNSICYAQGGIFVHR